MSASLKVDRPSDPEGEFTMTNIRCLIGHNIRATSLIPRRTLVALTAFTMIGLTVPAFAPAQERERDRDPEKSPEARELEARSPEAQERPRRSPDPRRGRTRIPGLRS